MADRPAAAGGSLKSIWYASPLYRLALSGKAPQAFVAVPPDPWPGDGVRGNAMLAGEFAAAGRKRAIDGDPWAPGGAQDGAPAEWLAELHGFAWLRDVKEVGGEEPARFAAAMVDGWIARNGRIAGPGWRADVLASRLTHWIASSAMIFRGADRSFIERFFKSLALQRRHLMRVVPGELAGSALLRGVKGLVYAHLALAEREAPLQAALQLLTREIARQVMPDGGHCERSPAVQVALLRDLIDIRGALLAAHKEMPAAVQSAIDRMAPMVRFFRHGDGGLALFNDTDEGDPSSLDLLLARSGASGKPLTHAPHSGFQRLSAGGVLAICDVGAPPARPNDAHAHAGTLSFEFSVGKERMIVNCGALPGADDAWRRAQRTTAAHSTAVLDDTNSAELRADGSLGVRPEKVASTRNEADGAIWVEAQHDGYLRHFGVIHKRRLYLAAAGNDLRGEDAFMGEGGKRVKGGGKPFAVRFHLHPDTKVSLVQNGASALIQLGNGQGWRFRASGAALSLSDSIYLGLGGQMKRIEQIVLSGTLQPDGAIVKWGLTRV
ncbi:MAG: heparinase II/III family protein [Reyranellaceae bacterium]